MMRSHVISPPSKEASKKIYFIFFIVGDFLGWFIFLLIFTIHGRFQVCTFVFSPSKIDKTILKKARGK